MIEVITNIFGSSIGKIFLIDIGIQWVGWAFAVAFKTEKFYDLTGSVTFILSAYLSHEWSPQTTRQNVQSHMVMGWAARLGLFLFARILHDGEDKRFVRAKEDPSLFFKFWTIQGIWVFVTMLPTLMLNSSERDRPLGNLDVIGWGLWAIGMGFEVIADFQKSAFRRNPNNKGKFITTGLWSISRHPNYFGEVLLWFGLYISASSVFRRFQYLSVLSPVFVYLLITRLSGIPLLEKAGLKKWGHLPEYQNYIKNTPCFIPFINWG